MKTLTLSLTIAISLTLGLASLQSQAPAAPRTSKEALQLMKTANEKMLERQAATLLKLAELEKSAQQLRLFAARN